jgi:hypothetical protein
MEKQLRLDAVERRRVEQRLKKMPQESLFHFASRIGTESAACAGLREREDVADYSFGLLIDTEDISGDLACFERHVTGQHVAVKILHQQLG